MNNFSQDIMSSSNFPSPVVAQVSVSTLNPSPFQEHMKQEYHEIRIPGHNDAEKKHEYGYCKIGIRFHFKTRGVRAGPTQGGSGVTPTGGGSWGSQKKRGQKFQPK